MNSEIPLADHLFGEKGVAIKNTCRECVTFLARCGDYVKGFIHLAKEMLSPNIGSLPLNWGILY
jgi:hypothetical protein